MTILETPPSILLVEQDAALQANLERLFSRCGWACRISTSAEQSLALLKQQHFDVVVSDVLLPEQPLLAFIQGVKSINSDQALIVLATQVSAAQAVELFRYGASDFLQKPCDLDALERSIQRLLNSTRKNEHSERWFKCVTHEKVVYAFDAATFAAHRMPLWIADKLHMCGKIDLNTKLKLQLVFDEAATNSNDHGNLELRSEWKEEFDEHGVDRYTLSKRQRLADPAYARRKLGVELLYDGTQLCITLCDQGPGFPGAEKLNCAQAQSKTEQLHGRGLGIIRSLMDQVTYSDGGRVVKMVKRFA